MTPRQLFDWASTDILGIHFGYSSSEDYEREQRNLEQRFQQSCTVPGTRKLHSFVSLSRSKARVSFYSSSNTSREEKATLSKHYISPESIVGFVTCLCDGNWWLACVLEIIQEESHVKLTFLNRMGLPVHSNIQKPKTYVLYK